MASPSYALDEGAFVGVAGVEQWVTLRGRAVGNPVLLLVHGPGFAMSPMAPFFAPWERRFTLAQWDQPGAGATHARNGVEGTGPLSLERLTRDGIAVVEFLRERLGAERVTLLAVSGGTIPALMMVRARPDLFGAYVGSGQVVSWARQEQLSYAMILARARAAGDATALRELEGLGAPPYPDVESDALKSKYAGALTDAEQAAFAAVEPTVLAELNAPPEHARYLAPGLPSFDARAQSMAVFEALRDEIAAFDARRLGLDFAVPLFFLQGELDAYTVSSEVEKYAAEVRGATARFVSVRGGGHSCYFMRDVFLRLLDTHVRPLSLARTASGR